MQTSKGDLWKTLVLLTVAAACLFAELLFMGGLCFPAHTDALSPWRHDADVDQYVQARDRMNRTATDKNFSFHPENMVTHEAFREGRLPLWNRHQMAGFPHLGQSLYGIFYPLNLPLFLVNPEWLYGPLTAVHFLLAGFFTYLLLRRFGLSMPAAVAGGLIFMCSANMTGRFHYYMTIYPMAWAPLMLYLIDRYHEKRSLLCLAGLAPVGAMIILAGFQQMAVFLFYIGLAYSLFRTAKDKYQVRINRGLMAIVVVTAAALVAVLVNVEGVYVYCFGLFAACLGFLAAGKGFFRWIAASLPVAAALLFSVILCAVQMAPVAALMFHSVRGWNLPEVMVEQGFPVPEGLTGFLMPLVLCDPTWHLSTTEPLNFAGMFLSGTTEEGASEFTRLNYMENTLYIGLLPLILIFLNRLKSGRTYRFMFMAVLSLLLLLFAAGSPWLVYPVWFLPGFQVGTPLRALLVFSFFASLLAAFGLERVTSAETPHLRRPFILAYLLMIVAIPAGVGGLFFNEPIASFLGSGAENPHDEAVLIANAEHLRTSLLHFAIAAAVGGVALIQLAMRPGRLACLFVMLAVFIDLAALSWHVNPPQEREGFLDVHPSIALMQPKTEEDHHRIFRYTREEEQKVGSLIPLAGDMATHFDIEDGEGYIVQPLRRYYTLVNAIQPDPPIAPLGSVAVWPVTRPEALNSPVLDLIGVKYILSTRAFPVEAADFEEIYNRRGIHVYENEAAFPRAFLVSEARFFDPEDPGRDQAMLEAMLSPETDLRRAAMVEAAPFEVEGGDGPLPSALVRYPGPEEVEITFDGECPGGILVLTDAFYPGWKAEVDGTPVTVMPADIAFRAVALPKGSQKVTFRFEPREVKIGAITSLAALGVLLAFTVFSFFWSRRRKEE